MFLQCCLTLQTTRNRYHSYYYFFPISSILIALQLERKRHLGNDVVVIIFKEGNHLFDPGCLRSEFNHVFVIVQKYGIDEEGHTLYKIEISCKDSVVQPWRPLLPDPPIFKKDEFFKKWFILKRNYFPFFLSSIVELTPKTVINAERACMFAPSFINKFTRTRKILLTDLVQNHLPKNKV